MSGPLIFALSVIAVLVLGTYLLQAVILAVQVAVVLAIVAAKALLYSVGLIVYGGWWLVDRKAAEREWRRGREPAGWAEGL